MLRRAPGSFSSTLAVGWKVAALVAGSASKQGSDVLSGRLQSRL